MVVSEDSILVDFDADAAVSSARELFEGEIHLCVEYTIEEFHTLYADENTLMLYGDREQMTDHFEDVHSYVHVDFTERGLFEDMFVGAGGVRSFVTHMEYVTLIRVLDGKQGLFLTVDPETDVTGIVEAVEAELD
jgi:hypothetical protein